MKPRTYSGFTMMFIDLFSNFLLYGDIFWYTYVWLLGPKVVSNNSIDRKTHVDETLKVK